MSTPGFVFHQRSPSSPTIPLEPDFPSPPVIRPYPPNTRPQPISPSLGASFGSDITSVSDTIRPTAPAHPQPGPSFGRASTPGLTFGSTASSAAAATAPAPSDAGQSSSTFSPSRFKLLGRAGPMDRAELSAGLNDASRPSFLPVHSRATLRGPLDSFNLGSGDSEDVALAGGSSRPSSTRPRPGVGEAVATPPSARSTDSGAYRYEQPGPRLDLPHLEAFEQSASLSRGGVNELGTMRPGLPPAVSRSSSGSERVPSPRLSPPPLNFPMHFPIARVNAPPVRPRIGFSAAPVTIPLAAHRTAPIEPPRRSGVADLFIAYGNTGLQWEHDAQEAVSPISQTATDGSAISVMPSVPPSRPSRSMISDMYHDREDFSPHRLGRRSREEAEDRIDRPNPTQAFGAIRPTSQLHRDRLARTDAFRLRAGGLDPLVPAGQWTRPFFSDEHVLATELQLESRGRSSAMDVSSRQGRFALDDNRDLRSRVRRRLSINDADTIGDGEGSSEIGIWNRDVQDAIGRRVAGDQPHSPASAARRHREISGPYSRARPVAERSGNAERQRAPWPYSDWQAGMPWAGQDTLHIDTMRSIAQDPLATIPPVAFGWRSHFGTAASASSTTAQGATRRADSPSMYSERSVDLFRAGRDASPDAPLRLSGDMAVLDAASGDDEEMEEDVPGIHPVFSAGAQMFGNYWPPYGMDPGAYPPRLVPHEMLGQVHFTAEMDQAERVKMARSIAKGIARWPGITRRRAAETVVENKAWGDMESSEEMEKDVCCSVCHDDVSEGLGHAGGADGSTSPSPRCPSRPVNTCTTKTASTSVVMRCTCCNR